MKPKSAAARLASMTHCGIIDPNNRPVVKAGQYGIARIEKELDALSLRASIRLGEDRSAGTVAWVKEAKEAIHTDDWLKSKGEVVLAAASGDRQAQALHAAAIQIVTTNVVTANSVWMPFFEERTLQPEDVLVIGSETHGMAITVDAIGQDGGRIMIQSQMEDPSPIFIPINMRTTPWIEYPLIDLYKGQVKELALAQFDIPRDIAYRKDTLLGTFIMFGEANTRLTAAFDTTGAEYLRDYILHPGVVAANMPTGNLVTLAGNTITSLFRKEVFDEILKYRNGWGDNALEAGSFNPVEIVVSSSSMTDFLGQVALTTQGNMLVDQVFEGGFLMSYAGQKWVITGSNKISPTHGVAYVRFDQSIGVYAEKPSVAADIVDESPALRAQNKGRTTSQWAESIAMPKHWRKRILGVRFRTAS